RRYLGQVKEEGSRERVEEDDDAQIHGEGQWEEQRGTGGVQWEEGQVMGAGSEGSDGR
ncbi:unnamed protein product, partial [Closterium sp. Naga37s-1]